MTESLVAGLLAGFGIAIPVGAVATYLVTLTARTSSRVGAGAALGVASADGLYALLAVVGGAALTAVIAAIAGPLRWVSAAALVAVAIGIAVSAIRDHRAGENETGDDKTVPDDSSMTPLRAYGALLGITLLNPATVIYFSALVVGSKAAGASTAGQGAVFVLGAFIASASWQLLLVAGGVVLGRTLTGRRGRLITGLVSSAVILGLTVSLLLAG